MTPRISVSEEVTYEVRIQEVQAKLEAFQQSEQQVTNAEELMALETEIRRLTNQLAAAMLGQKLQQAVNSEAIEQEEKKR